MGIMLFVGTLSNDLPNSGPFKGCEIDGKGQGVPISNTLKGLNTTHWRVLAGVTYSPQKSITGIQSEQELSIFHER